MLGVVAELDHVPAMVVGFQKVRLGAASHFSKVPYRCERHERKFALT
jgi:hypothetical protein